jgi:hypothetical protein
MLIKTDKFKSVFDFIGVYRRPSAVTKFLTLSAFISVHLRLKKVSTPSTKPPLQPLHRFNQLGAYARLKCGVAGIGDDVIVGFGKGAH